MHSSGMRTAHLLTVSQHALHREGLPGGGVCPGGCLPLVPGVCVCIPVCNGADSPPVDRQTPVKHNLRKLRLRAVINRRRYWVLKA